MIGSVDILIVDDDPIVGQLTHELLRDAGFNPVLIQDSLRAIQTVKELRPRLVILDILMPGINGLALCKMIKSDPSIQDTRVIIVSGKSFQVEKERAAQHGADLFIEKPYDVELFAQKISELVKAPAPTEAPSQPPSPAAPPAAPAPETAVFKVQIWGCRSSVLEPDFSRYGTQTACVSVEAGSRFFILDAGSGIVPLGKSLMQKQSHKDVWIFLSHYHLNHIQGLGLFPCAQDPQFSLHLAGANDLDQSLQQFAQNVFYNPATRQSSPPKARLDLYELLEGNFQLVPEIKFSAFYANHPTTTLGFRFENGGKKIVFCPDSEIYGDPTALQDYNEKLIRFCQNADLLIHDSRFTDEDYESHKNEGHSAVSNAVEIALQSGVKQLVLFHDSPYPDEKLDEMLDHAKKTIRERNSPMDCLLASEGLTLNI